MKKFKVVSTCASLLLMVALLVFGVYAAAGSTATFAVNSTVSFTVQDVYIKVAASSGTAPTNDTTYYYSQPSGSQQNISALTALPDCSFSDETTNGNVLNYYIYVENLHGQDINVAFACEWTSSSKYNASSTNEAAGAVTVTAKMMPTINGTAQTDINSTIANATPTVANGVRTDKATSFTVNHVFKKIETVIYLVTITLKSEAMDYKLSDSTLKLSAKASLDAIENMNA